MERKKEYIKPALTVVSIKAEKGYAESIKKVMFWLSLQHNQTEQLEAYETANGWTQDNNVFWN